MTSETPPHEYACCRCRGSNVVRDAWAIWNVTQQQWEIDALFDHAFCLDCDKVADLIERQVPAER